MVLVCHLTIAHTLQSNIQHDSIMAVSKSSGPGLIWGADAYAVASRERSLLSFKSHDCGTNVHDIKIYITTGKIRQGSKCGKSLWTRVGQKKKQRMRK